MSAREKRKKAVGFLLVALVLALSTTPHFRAMMDQPARFRLPVGQVHLLAFHLPFRAIVSSNPEGALSLDGERLGATGRKAALSAPLSIAALQTGEATVDVRLFGWLPFRRVRVDVVPPIRVIPGGHSIGVLLRSRGVIVVGYAPVRTENGETVYPGKQAGIEPGDTILEIGGREVTSEEQAARLFEDAGRVGRPVSVRIKRKGKYLEKELIPVREKESKRFRAGLYIRDGAAGVGTLTFYHPTTGKYGALGHVIADGESSQPIDVRDGHIVESLVTAIQKGHRGAPGEKIGSFKDEDNWLGSIEKNTRFGIFGSLHSPLQNPLFPDPVPVAMAGQVKEGPAEILTVVEGQRLERFQVEIQRVIRQPASDGKNMIIKITDPRLLSRTGGIVQGMSGSPILQDGRLVGAVTHVFVNDPSRGYGALIEWMLQEAGILQSADRSSLRDHLPGALVAWRAWLHPGL
jgi:stage IV sporulation protein B